MSLIYSTMLFISQHAGELALSVIIGTAVCLTIIAIMQKKLNKNVLIEPGMAMNKAGYYPASQHLSQNVHKKPIKSTSIKQKLETIEEIESKPKVQRSYASQVFYAGKNNNNDKNKNKNENKNINRDIDDILNDLNVDKHGPLTPSVPNLLNPSKSQSLSYPLEIANALASIQKFNDNQDNKNNQNNKNNKNNVLSPTSHIEQLQNELDTTNYPQYLDGYCQLNHDQKTFLCAIKKGDIDTIKYMTSHCKIIAENINFGENQVVRECTLGNRLEILKYLKQKFMDKIDLNCESGYCLRWSSRKGFIGIVNYLLYQQKYQKIDISMFTFQAIEWSIINGHKQIAKLLQKYYNQQCQFNNNNQEDLGLEFEFFNLPSIYQDIIQRIIDGDDNNNNDQSNTDNNNVEIIKKYYKNGCDLKFNNNMPWTVAVDCTNIPILQFLHETIGVDPLCSNMYLLRTAVEMKSIELLQFAKIIINWHQWQQKVEPKISQLMKLCTDNDEIIIKELENYHQSFTETQSPNRTKKNEFEFPQSPIPWPYENEYVRQKYGILTRSMRKKLVKKGILQDVKM